MATVPSLNNNAYLDHNWMSELIHGSHRVIYSQNGQRDFPALKGWQKTMIGRMEASTFNHILLRSTKQTRNPWIDILFTMKVALHNRSLKRGNFPFQIIPPTTLDEYSSWEVDYKMQFLIKCCQLNGWLIHNLTRGPSRVPDWSCCHGVMTLYHLSDPCLFALVGNLKTILKSKYLRSLLTTWSFHYRVSARDTKRTRGS